MMAIIKLDHQYYTIMFCVSLFIFIFAFAPTTTSFKFNNETDLLSLLAFKSVVQDPLGSLSSWNQSTHFCNWTGIRCGSRHPDRVVGISLRSGGLVGSLSPHLGIIQEVYANFLKHETANPDSKKYAKSYVREYGMSCPMSVQGDTYSYGVVLLEMFTNKRPTDLSRDHVNLHCFVSAALHYRVMELVDPQFQTHMNNGKIKDCLASVLSIGVSVSKETPRERMATTNVVNELHKIQRLLTRTS